MSVKMAGQTINDRLLAARHSIAGQGLAKSVCKATTEEMIGPKRKHLDYLVHCTNEPNVSIPQLANLLVERSQSTNWVVVYKALITVHHLLAFGNERFTQYLASSNSSFQVSNFLDKSGMQGAVCARIGYDMSPFIRRYAKYLNEKALSYRTVAFDFCKVKRGKEEGSLRTMNAEKLLKTLPVLQAQLDSLLEFDCTANDLTNGVINMCFTLLFRDLIRLFACYNDGIINLLEKYFDMNKKQCRDALDLYKKFLIRMDRVGEFLKVAENVGIDKGEIPDLTKAPSSLLDALESHLAALEGKKGSAANTPTQTASVQKNVANGMGALSSTGSSFGSAAASTKLDQQAANGQGFIDDVLKQQALAEEEAVLNQYKSKVQSPTNSAALATNPFLSSGAPPAQQQSIVDLFGSPPVTQTDGASGTKASDDLLQLGNPFSDMFGDSSAITTAPAPSQQPPWMGGNSNGFGAVNPAQNNQNNTFVSDSSFSNVFGNNDQSAAGTMANPFAGESFPLAGGSPARPPPPSQPKSALDDLNDTILMALGGSPSKQPPQQSLSMSSQQFGSPAKQQQPVSQMGFDGMGDVLRPAGAGGATGNAQAVTGAITGAQTAPAQQAGKVLTGDLDSSLALLANNLTINKSAQQAVKGVQWNSPKNTAKSGTVGWTPQPMAATTGAGYRPMGQGMQLPLMSHTFHNQHHFNMQQQQSQQPPSGAPMMGGGPPARPPPPSSQPTVPLDPFGAL